MSWVFLTGWLVPCALEAQALDCKILGKTTWLREAVLNNRRDLAMAYHADARHIVLFGGSDRNDALGDTWVWTGSDWYPRWPVVSPDARYDHAMAYDAARKVTVLFGGRHGSGILNDTWEWDGEGWTCITTPHAPAARYGHAMAYDARRGRILVFGGETGFHDTWEYDGKDWVEVHPARTPPVLRGTAMAFDAKHGVTVLFGGKEDRVGYGQSTWIYDGVTWTEVSPQALPLLPDGRREHAMVYSPSHRRVILFGGYRCVGNQETWLGDTWAWDGAEWTPIRPTASKPGPTPRYRHAAAFDEIRNQLVVYGGSRDNVNVILLSDTWVNGLDDAGWTDTCGESPTARCDHAMSYDLKRRHVVLFGGDDGEAGHTVLRDDTWIWNNLRWRELDTEARPSGRRDHKMVHVSSRGHHLLFGGDDGVRRLDDTWIFDGESWKSLDLTFRPPARSRHTMTALTCGRILLFGGFDGVSKLGDTWMWDGKTWTEVQTLVAPSRRSRSAMAYDPIRGRVVLFGGKIPGEVKLNDTWEFDGKTWTRVKPSFSPSPRTGHAMVYDRLKKRVVLVGGQYEKQRLADAYEWDGKNWKRIYSEHYPPVRSRHAMVYNAARQRVVLFGGYGEVKPVSDTWCLVPIRLWAEKTEVKTGGRVKFEVKAAEEAGKFYLCVLAFNKAPGVQVPVCESKVDLPLKPDSLTLASLHLKGFSGVLDKWGMACYSIKVGKDPNLVGLKFYASVLTYCTKLQVGAVTNEVPVVIVK